MELRKDYVLNRWVIVANNRSKRPSDFAKQHAAERENIKCPFCPGNEEQTPPEIGRIPNSNSWKIRWFDNKFSAAELNGNYVIRTDNTYFTFSDAFGKHEVVVDTPEHNKKFYELDENTIAKLLKIYSERVEELSKINGIAYVQVFKNSGSEAGASLQHEHTQILATNKVPTVVDEMVNAAKSFGFCPYCQILNIEKRSYRRCFESGNFVSFTPYASRFPFEIWLFPKEHIRRMSELSAEKFLELASMLKKILKRVSELNVGYNMMFYHAPKNSDLHFHIEILPRTSTWAGMEFSGIYIITISPEDSALFYREENK
ncbi:MAG: galactose-1-phosphate uridylyltransferase [Candidatus Woesearchaeota archaeon]